jgi:Tripartite tricarboxylate transporter TctB family
MSNPRVNQRLRTLAFGAPTPPTPVVQEPLPPVRPHAYGPFVVPAFAVVYCATFLYESRGLAFRQAGYPRVIIGIFFLLIAGIVTREILRFRRRDSVAEVAAAESPVDPNTNEPIETMPEQTVVPGTRSWWPTVLISALLVGLVWVMPRIGSVPAIAIFTLVLPPLLGYRKHLITIIACLLTVAVTNYIFIYEFGVPLP